jgi:tetratricopeptide (TPR) repeat protein
MTKTYSAVLGSVILLLVLLLIGCSSNQEKVLKPKPQAPRAEELNEKAYNFYVNGVIYEQESLYSEAADSYEHALSYAPLSYDIRMALGKLYSSLGRPHDALNAIGPIQEKQAETYVLMGDCHKQLGQDAQAQAAYENALALNPHDIEVNYQLGMYAVHDGDLAKAADYFKAAAHLSRNPDLFEQAAKAYAGAGELDSAATYYKAALSSSGDDPSLYSRLAIFYATADMRDKAEQVLQEGLQRYPDGDYLMAQLIGLYAEDNQRDSILALAPRLIEAGSDNYHIYETVGQVLIQNDAYDLASQCFHRALDLNDASVPSLFYLGRLAVQDDQLDSAVQYFTELSDVEPELPDGWINLALIYSRKKAPEEARAVLNEALKSVTDGRDDVRFYLAQLLSEDGQKDSAVTVLKGIIAEGGDTIRALFNIGATYEQMGKFDKSVQAFELLLASDSTHAQALNYLGYMFADRNVRLDESLRMIERAVSMDSTNGAYLDSYAWVLYRLDRLQDALVQIEKAVTLMPDDPTVREHLGDIYFALGQKDNAHQAWERALALDPNNESLKDKLSGR